MRPSSDDRAVAMQVGAVLLLAIFVLAFAQYQLDVVPGQNHEVERDHNERVIGELIDLRDTITAAGYQDGTRGTSITLGTQYQSRILAMNPPQPRGTLATGDPSTVTIEGVEDGPISLTSHPLVYEPAYNEYTDAPTTYIEHTAVVNDYPETASMTESPTIETEGAVIVPIMDGTFSRTTSGTISVEVETLESYRVGSGDDATVAVETDHPGAWERLDAWSVDETAGTATFEAGDRDVVLAHVSVGDATESSESNRALISAFGEPFTSVWAPGNGDPGDPGEGDLTFERVFVEDVASEATEQVFEFELTGGLDESETVAIDLDDPQDQQTGPPGDREGVNYAGADVDDVDAGTADIDVAGNDGTATLTFTAGPEGVASGETIELTVDGIEVQGDDGEFEVTFTRSDSGETVTTTFEITQG